MTITFTRSDAGASKGFTYDKARSIQRSHVEQRVAKAKDSVWKARSHVANLSKLSWKEFDNLVLELADEVKRKSENSVYFITVADEFCAQSLIDPEALEEYKPLLADIEQAIEAKREAGETMEGNRSTLAALVRLHDKISRAVDSYCPHGSKVVIEDPYSLSGATIEVPYTTLAEWAKEDEEARKKTLAAEKEHAKAERKEAAIAANALKADEKAQEARKLKKAALADAIEKAASEAAREFTEQNAGK